MADLLRPRIGSKRHPGTKSLGPIVAEIADRLGMPFFAWQRHRADVSYELEPCPTGRRLAAGTCLTLAGRQTGKTAAVTADVAFRCLAPELPAVEKLVGHPVGPQHVAFTAQDRIGALGRWYEHVEMIMASPLADRVARISRKNGEECVHWVNGSKYRVVTPSKTGARGLSLDLVVIDEALAHAPWLLDAMAPTMAQRDGASASFGAQLVIVSNAGDERAELLNQQREIGRRAVAEDERSRVHLEWSCSDEADPLDPAVWAQTIPTLDRPDGLSTAFLARQAETMGTDAFAREYLCRTVWSEDRRVIDTDDWADLPHVVLRPSGQAVVAVEVTPDRSWSTVVVACRVEDDLIGVEVVDQRPGVDWVVERVAQLVARTRCRVVLDRYGPASPLTPGLEQAGVKVEAIQSASVADAAAGLVDAVAARRVGHDGDVRLTNAVAVLGRRQRGDRWVFDRHGGDVSAVVAASLAVWLVDTRPTRIPAIH